MLIIPAIDLQGGCVVRYVQGKLDKKVYSRSPLTAAKHWIKQGAQFLHIVDLDAAFTGQLKNFNCVKEIADGVRVPLEVGGGIRSVGAIRKMLGLGVRRVVLGTKAAQDEVFLKKAFKQFKERIIVSIDAKDGQVFVRGWKDSDKKKDAFAFARALEKIGFKEAIFTDIAKDGTLTGPNIKGIKAFLKETGLSIIASGGISSLDDLRKLKKLEKEGLSGVIVGKALYEGKFTLAEALKLS